MDYQRKNRKEELKHENIVSDLLKNERWRGARDSEHREVYLLPLLTIAVTLWIFTKTFWIGAIPFFGAIYPAVLLARDIRSMQERKRRILAGDYTIVVETLSHITEETIYEPHVGRSVFGRSNVHATRTASFFYFSTHKWRVQGNNYEWSEEYPLSYQGIMNVSLEGDSFYVVSLEPDDEAGCVYPCKYFVCPPTLGKKNGPSA